jgi:hypothetical protein
MNLCTIGIIITSSSILQDEKMDVKDLFSQKDEIMGLEPTSDCFKKCSGHTLWVYTTK